VVRHSDRDVPDDQSVEVIDALNDQPVFVG
jgi:hypothetical protein